jgi:peptidyl-prolyl cis-trans isomerase A (cyclophilin A)
MTRLTFAAAFAALALSLAPALAAAPAAPAPAPASPLANPAALTEKAPEKFTVKLDTSKGPVVIEVTRAWAPNGADRFYNLVKNGFFDDARFFRVLPGFMAQVGINADPKVSLVWRQARIPDDPVKESNKRGYVTYATSGPNSRTTQFFINFDDNSALDRQGFSPFGRVTTGMDVAEKLFAGYGEGAPQGRGPDQSLVQLQGNAYLNSAFPNLDYIKKATIEP